MLQTSKHKHTWTPKRWGNHEENNLNNPKGQENLFENFGLLWKMEMNHIMHEFMRIE